MGGLRGEISGSGAIGPPFTICPGTRGQNQTGKLEMNVVIKSPRVVEGGGRDEEPPAPVSGEHWDQLPAAGITLLTRADWIPTLSGSVEDENPPLWDHFPCSAEVDH